MRTRIRWLLGRIAHAAVEATYPKTCAGCGMRGMWLCDLCDGSVPAVTVSISCMRCGAPRLNNRCGCRDLDRSIQRARAAFAYDGWAANAVRRLKYEGEPARAEHMGALMVPLLASFGPIDGIVPVPLHPSRERDRGYNQALLLGTVLADASGVPLLPLLRRTTATPSQTTLSSQARRQNVANAFALDPAWQPRPGGRFLLVDDVRTTASTLNACAAALAPCAPAMLGGVTFALDLPVEHLDALRNAAHGSKAVATPAGLP